MPDPVEAGHARNRSKIPGQSGGFSFWNDTHRGLSLLLLFIIAPAVSNAAAAAEVSAIEVRLFQSHTGMLSEPVASGTTLWNIVIGEGIAHEPSTSTLVKVRVTGEPSSYKKNAVVHLTIKVAGMSSRAKTMKKSLDVFGPNGYQFVAFWLPNTGCQPIFLSARTTGSSRSLEHELPFRCGE